MDAPFTFIDRAVTLRFFPEDPVEVRLYLGDLLEEKLRLAAAHYDAPHSLEEDEENLRNLLGPAAEELLSRAAVRDRLTVIELLTYTVRALREAQGKKLEALTAG